MERVTESQLDTLLLAIERLEIKSLQWGATSASLSEDEIVYLARGIVEGDPEDAAGELLERRLLFQIPAPGGGVRYRSRFAEGVRLLTALRQVFPGRSWQSAPSLVSDFRVDLRERKFPRRDRSSIEVIERLRDGLSLNPQDVLVAESLVSGMSLSAFQERTAEAVLRDASADRGVLISAGTGSGKTLAYYLPAIICVARHALPNQYWTKAISVYPRNELLKDQFGEVLEFVQRVGNRSGRPLRIGTFFGLTPTRADVTAVSRSWKVPIASGEERGYVCPFAVCPNCKARLIWWQRDIEQGKQTLLCESRSSIDSSCHFATDPEQVLLTRQAAQKKPPDLLFTTAETLNQRMSDPGTRRLLGIGQARAKRPLFMLLDEVHTYEGMSGAQAAMVFRRWRKGVRSPVRWVGLSATLREGPAFLGQVIGVNEAAIEEVTPEVGEFETKAAEYQLILRGDPLARASLLSTTIQVSFLLARLLDPSSGPSVGRAGHRAFVFTDDLDVTNRLYGDLRDAEYKHLAQQRSSDHVKGEVALTAGQQWRSVEQIGWDLSDSLEVSRTSSQDAGVSATSQLVVATGSLEVGFDDNRVGAVIQHKSPYRMSSFVQRKGRAGRTQEMRPWMVTVLSDYGRDRYTYQTYDRLFDPIIEPQRLPIANGYVRRMHAGFAFMDWLETHLESNSRWWWWAVDGPTKNNATSRQQGQLRRLIDSLLDGDDPDSFRLLRDHLKEALKLEDSEVDAILWQPPRSLMLELLPTLSRRLATKWKTAVPLPSTGGLDAVSNSPYPRPLPEFLPPNLFTDLNLPEVAISGPRIEESESLLIEQALRHLAPGRVTRRFAPHHGGIYHWVPVPTDGSRRYELPLGDFIPRSHGVTQVAIELNGSPQELTIYRPWEMSLSLVPSSTGSSAGNVLPSSNGRLLWRTQIIPRSKALSIEAAHDPVWSKFINGLEFYLHDQRSPLTVRRFAAEAEADLRLRGSSQRSEGRFEQPIQVLFRDPDAPGRPAAIGYEAEVDGMAVRFREFDRDSLARDAEEAPSRAAWRTAYVRDLIASDPYLSSKANEFLRGWMFELFSTGILEVALEQDIHASAANQLLSSDADVDSFKRIFSRILPLAPQAERPEEGADDENSSSQGESALLARLMDLLSDSEVRDRLGKIFAECWAPSPEKWPHWLERALHRTLSEAARSAVLETAPDHVTEDSVRLDLGRQGSMSSDFPPEAWVTESAIGGSGVIEAIATAYASEPRSFFRALEFKFIPSEFEVVSGDLNATVELGVSDDEVRNALTAAREAESHADRNRRMQELSGLLHRHGITPGHAFFSAINQRLLRPGMTSDSHRLLRDLMSFWSEMERRHEIAIDLRVFCSLAVQDVKLGTDLDGEGLRKFLNSQAGVELKGSERTGVLMGLLWPRQHEIRRHTLGSWSPFRDPGFSDSSLVRELLLGESESTISVSDPGWHAQFVAVLSRTGVVRVKSESNHADDLQSALFRTLAEPIDVGFLQLYPTVEQVRRQGHELVATVVLKGIV